MSGNTFGKIFRITTFGESHGRALGVIVDGVPSEFSLDLAAVEKELGRRRPGQSKLVSPRAESDKLEVLSGLFEGKTTGAPLCFVIFNEDVRSKDYDAIKDLFRPGHADFPYFAKYGHRDYRGGGRSSARETAARVIGGAIGKQLLATKGIRISGGVVQIGTVKAARRDWEQVESNEVRSTDGDTVAAMIAEIDRARKDRDSVGGIIEIVAEGVPPGFGEPVFEKLDAALAFALMSIPAVKGVEIGEGFGSASLRGSAMNDIMTPEGFESNRHGGILGGISSGAPIVCRFAVKPTSSLPKAQRTINKQFQPCEVTTLGRHDPCVAIRAVPIGEAMVSLVLADYWLQELAARGAHDLYAPSPEIRYGMARKEGR